MADLRPVLTSVLRPCLRRAFPGTVSGSKSFDADALTWYNAVVTAGGAGEWGSTAGARLNNKNALNTMVKALKAASLWTGFKMRVLAGTNSIAGGLASGIGGTITNNNFVSGDINPLTGWLGNGTTKRLTSDWAGNANGQNNHCLWAWVGVASAIAGRALAGNAVSGAGTTNIITGTTNYGGRCTSATAYVSALPDAPLGFVGISRAAAGSYTQRICGTNLTASITSDGVLAATYDIFGRKDSVYFDGRITAFGVGPACTLATLDSILTTYHAAIQA